MFLKVLHPIFETFLKIPYSYATNPIYRLTDNTALVTSDTFQRLLNQQTPSNRKYVESSKLHRLLCSQLTGVG